MGVRVWLRPLSLPCRRRTRRTWDRWCVAWYLGHGAPRPSLVVAGLSSGTALRRRQGTELMREAVLRRLMVLLGQRHTALLRGRAAARAVEPVAAAPDVGAAAPGAPAAPAGVVGAVGPGAGDAAAGSPTATYVHGSDSEPQSGSDDGEEQAAGEASAGSGDEVDAVGAVAAGPDVDAADGGDEAANGAPSAVSVLAPRRPDSRAYAQDRFGAAASVASVSAWLLTTTESVAERSVIGAFAAAAHSGASILLLFSGPGGREDGLAAQLRTAGARVLEIDILIGERLHDLTRVGPDSIGDHLLRVARGGEFTAMHAAIPCSTYSVVRSAADVLRSAQYPLGLPGLSFANSSKVWLSNALMYYVLDMAQLIVGCGGEVSIENPAPRGDPCLPKAYWAAKSGHASLFRKPPMLAYAAATRSVELITPLCAFGMAMQKMICVLMTPRMAVRLAHIGAKECTHASHE